MFVPQFKDFVFGLAPNGVKFGISKEYCLTKASAVELAKLVGNPDIVDGTPVPNIGNRFQYSSLVPFFVFNKGTEKEKVRNAGIIAMYWVWFSGSRSLEQANIDIADDYTGEELLA